MFRLRSGLRPRLCFRVVSMSRLCSCFGHACVFELLPYPAFASAFSYVTRRSFPGGCSPKWHPSPALQTRDTKLPLKWRARSGLQIESEKPGAQWQLATALQTLWAFCLAQTRRRLPPEGFRESLRFANPAQAAIGASISGHAFANPSQAAISTRASGSRWRPPFAKASRAAIRASSPGALFAKAAMHTPIAPFLCVSCLRRCRLSPWVNALQTPAAPAT